MIYETDSLTHYGVLGMKWGVRKDRKRYGDFDYEYSDRQKARMSRIARGVLTKSAKTDMQYGTRLMSNGHRLAYKAANTQLKAEQNFQRGKTDKAWSQTAKAQQTLIKAQSRIDAGKKLVASSAIKQMKASAITSGELQAGKDFVARKYYYAVPTPVGVFVGSKATLNFREDSNT